MKERALRMMVAAGIAAFAASAYLLYRSAPRFSPPVGLRDSLRENFHGFPVDAEDPGAKRCDQCHLRGGDSASFQTPPSMTAICLSCHDGSVTRASNAYSGHGRSAFGTGFAHPVGADYYAVLRRNPEGYHHPGQRPEIRLENGRVGCISCHAVHGRLQTQDLCSSCHKK